MPAFQLYEKVLGLDPRGRSKATADGPPLPPPALRVAVSCTVDPDWFIAGGRREVRLIRQILAKVGENPLSLTPILDFGCGCGRVIRHWLDLNEVYGCDCNPRLVDWCSANLPFNFKVNDIEPPLPYADSTFGLVYGISVLTHLPTPLDEAWLADLARVLRPAGLLLLTTQGDRFRDRLTPKERRLYDAGGIVVRRPQGKGTNLCSVYHPPSYLQKTPGLQRIAFRAGDRQLSQDMSLLRRI